METNPSCASPGRRNEGGGGGSASVVAPVTTRYFVIEEGKHSRQPRRESRASRKKAAPGPGGDLINHPDRGSILSSYGNPVNYTRTFGFLFMADPDRNF